MKNFLNQLFNPQYSLKTLIISSLLLTPLCYVVFPGNHFQHTPLDLFCKAFFQAIFLFVVIATFLSRREQPDEQEAKEVREEKLGRKAVLIAITLLVVLGFIAKLLKLLEDIF